MNASIRKLTTALVKNNAVWKLLQPIIKVSEFISYQREVTQRVEIIDPDNDLFEKILQQAVVKHGPFTGLKYPSFTSYGSSIYPKILGCYELEITDIIQQIVNTGYTEILDIGCAEGYYAVGFALKSPSSKVYAYDTDEQARGFCKDMANLNGVADKVTINAFCSAETLAGFNFTKKGLIFCDCEGYEKQLFNKQNLPNLTRCDLLIETHDFIDITISEYIETLFKDTHDIQIIRSLDDITKAKTYNYAEAKNLDIRQREKLYHEGRPHIMEWYWLRSKQ